MNKKIIILNGSPRTNGNTSALIDAFISGAESVGNTVTRFDLKDMNIRGCLGCCKGGKNAESPCVQKDDMNKIYPYYREADVIVLASPMYYWSITGQLKCAFDRLFAVAECNENLANPIKSCALLMAAEGESESNFEPVRHFYTSLTTHMGWTNAGIVYAGGNFNIGDIQGKPNQLAEARALGASIA